MIFTHSMDVYVIYDTSIHHDEMRHQFVQDVRNKVYGRSGFVDNVNEYENEVKGSRFVKVFCRVRSSKRKFE
jgi:hypothetical protein